MEAEQQDIKTVFTFVAPKIIAMKTLKVFSGTLAQINKDLAKIANHLVFNMQIHSDGKNVSAIVHYQTPETEETTDENENEK